MKTIAINSTKGGTGKSTLFMEWRNCAGSKLFGILLPRKVRYYDKEFHHTYEFITNNFTLTAEEIASDLWQKKTCVSARQGRWESLPSFTMYG